MSDVAAELREAFDRAEIRVWNILIDGAAEIEHLRRLVETTPSESGRAAIKGGRIVIAVDIENLPVIVRGAADTNNWEGEYTVTDPAAFAKEIVYQLNSEDEQGTTDIHRMFDAAILEAISDGGEGIEVAPPAVTSDKIE